MTKRTRHRFLDGPYAIFAWLGVALLWLAFIFSFFAMTSRGWGSAFYVWLPMMLGGAWGIWFTFAKHEERHPGVTKRGAMHIAVALFTAYVVHKVWNRNRH
ncbi:hypothetical protein [Lentzea aerocolonigenes]|uniref:hypothetical protein n=1 Tax=Lentzea aerocolonigenes TaxID=68170 RepID=UPI0012E0F54A|nr:hypothetical protein [Lentzea aerocolonigenes]